MEDNEIISYVEGAIDRLYDLDLWLIENDLSEQSISHKLAKYLQDLIPEYNVDCEYNGNADDERGKKKISILKDRLRHHGLLRENEGLDLEKELTERAVFPDIIIHKRGNNEENKCIIEIKKNTSTVKSDYDYIKLSSYTSAEFGNYLDYQIGVFIRFYMNTKEKRFDIAYFKNGQETAKEAI